MKRKGILLLAAAGVMIVAISFTPPLLWKVRIVSGIVRDITGRPLSGATVRIKATGVAGQTDSAGRFTLTGFIPAFSLRITAWQDGYFVAGTDVRPWDATTEITLKPYAVPDNADYTWILPAVENRSVAQGWWLRTGLSFAAMVSFKDAFLPLADRLTLGCRDCHGPAIYDQWQTSGHALGTKNVRFLTMYNGTDIAGNKSPPTRFAYHRDYGSFPLPPDPTKPNYGPGYKLDFPNTTGNCAACHLPSAAIGKPYGVDPNLVAGVDAEGTHCDFCHKIAAVVLNPKTGRPFDNRPGILSIVLMRPSHQKQLFFGPFDDVDVGPDTYLPLMKQSDICSPCHSARFWSTPIYESFDEWLASPYPAEGKTCQSCHMTPDSVTTNFAPGRGGVERDPSTIPTHSYPGASDRALLVNAVTMDVRAERRNSQVTVRVNITNDKTGHHVPTDSPLRQMILLVKAIDSQGNDLELRRGPRVPEWGGNGDPDRGYFAGLPGKGFAKVLEELWTGISPTGAYWKPTRILRDNRIAAFATDSSTYTFSAPGDSEVSVSVKLLFRRAFIALTDRKGWNVPDIVMAKHSVLVGKNIMQGPLQAFPNGPLLGPRHR